MRCSAEKSNNKFSACIADIFSAAVNAERMSQELFNSVRAAMPSWLVQLQGLSMNQRN